MLRDRLTRCQRYNIHLTGVTCIHEEISRGTLFIMHIKPEFVPRCVLLFISLYFEGNGLTHSALQAIIGPILKCSSLRMGTPNQMHGDVMINCDIVFAFPHTYPSAFAFHYTWYGLGFEKNPRPVRFRKLLFICLHYQ